MLKKIWSKLQKSFVYKTIDGLIEHEAIEYAGYLTYLNVLAIFPFIFIIFAFISSFDETTTGLYYINLALSHLPEYVTQTFGKQIKDIFNGPSAGLMNIAVIGAIWTASSFVEALKAIFNRIHHVTDQPHYIIGRVLSIMQFIIFVMAILLSFVMFSLLPKLSFLFPQQLSHWQLFTEELNSILLNIILVTIVSLVYFSLTRVKTSLLSCVPGATITVILWNISAGLLSYYMKNFSQVSMMYGSLASIIITLIFLYAVNLILIYGAEINHQLKLRYR